MTDELRDLEMSTEDRQVFVDAEGDLSTTSGLRTVEQSLAITAGDTLRPLIGNPITDRVLGDVEAELQSRLETDPQITGPQRVEVQRVDDEENRVEVEVFTRFDESFTLDVIL